LRGSLVAGRGEAVGLRARRAVAWAMRLLYERGLVNLRGGNASARVALPDGTAFIYVSPSGGAKNSIDPLSVAVLSPEGHIYWGQPSSEYRLHLEAYRRLGDAYAVVHAHNPAAVLAARLGLRLDPRVLGVEASYYIGGCVAAVPELPPGTEELARAAAEALTECPVAVLEGHGAVAVGKRRDPLEAVVEAVDRLEALEDLARATLGQRLAHTGKH